MYFKRDGKTLWTATVTDSHIGILDGITEPIAEYANMSVALPLDMQLWHRRFGHHSFATIEKMIKDDLATGLVIDSKLQPDPVCEPCLAGKMC